MARSHAAIQEVLKALPRHLRFVRQHPTTFVAPLCLFVVTTALCLFAVIYSNAQSRAGTHQQLEGQAQITGQRIQGYLEAQLNPVVAIGSMLTNNPSKQVLEDQFVAIVGRMYNESFPRHSMTYFEVAPTGIISYIWPLNNIPEGLLGRDLLAARGYVPRQTKFTLQGPMPFDDNSNMNTQAFYAGYAVWVPGVDQNETWGFDRDVTPLCPTCYNSTRRIKYWGNVFSVTYLSALLKQIDDQLSNHTYVYRLYNNEANGSMHLLGRRGADSHFSSYASYRMQSFSVDLTIQVTLTHSWNERWLPGLVVVVVLVPLILTLMLHLMLIFMKKHEALLFALVPKKVVQEMKIGDHLMLGSPRGSSNGMGQGMLTQGTPAERMLDMLGSMLEGRTPDLNDIVAARAALLHATAATTMFHPADLKGDLLGAYEGDVALGLLRELQGLPHSSDHHASLHGKPSCADALFNDILEGCDSCEDDDPQKATNSNTNVDINDGLKMLLSMPVHAGMASLGMYRSPTSPGAVPLPLSPNRTACANITSLAASPSHASTESRPLSPSMVTTGLMPPTPAAHSKEMSPFGQVQPGMSPLGWGGANRDLVMLRLSSAGIANNRTRSMAVGAPLITSATAPPAADMCATNDKAAQLAAGDKEKVHNSNFMIRLMTAMRSSSTSLKTLAASAEAAQAREGGSVHGSAQGVASTKSPMSSRSPLPNISPRGLSPNASVVAIPQLLVDAGGSGDVARSAFEGSDAGGRSRRGSAEIARSEKSVPLPVEPGSPTGGPGTASDSTGPLPQPFRGSMELSRPQTAGSANEPKPDAANHSTSFFARMLRARSTAGALSCTAGGGSVVLGAGAAGNGIAAAASLQLVPEAPLVDELHRVLEDGYSSWSFDAFELERASCGHPLSAMGYFLLARTGLMSTWSIKPRKAALFFRVLEDGYRANPYHNKTHAADVLQTMHVILTRGGLLPGYGDSFTHLACILAAAAHDVEHLGLTNDFLVASQDDLAVLYNDRSPMENHHASRLFSLLKRPELNLLSRMTTKDRERLRKGVIELILATDMKHHCALTSQFATVHRLASDAAESKAKAVAGGGPSSKRNGNGERDSPDSTDSFMGQRVPIDDAERLLSLQIALKCADIGLCAEGRAVNIRWVQQLEEEFFAQGDREKAAGLPVSPLMDRDKPGVSKSQTGFYDFVALPMFHNFCTVFPTSRPMWDLLTECYRYWREKYPPPPPSAPAAGSAGAKDAKDGSAPTSGNGTLSSTSQTHSSLQKQSGRESGKRRANKQISLANVLSGSGGPRSERVSVGRPLSSSNLRRSDMGV